MDQWIGRAAWKYKNKSNNEFNTSMSLAEYKNTALLSSVLQSHFDKQFKMQEKELVHSQEVVELLEQELNKLKREQSPNATTAFVSPIELNLNNSK